MKVEDLIAHLSSIKDQTSEVFILVDSSDKSDAVPIHLVEEIVYHSNSLVDQGVYLEGSL